MSMEKFIKAVNDLSDPRTQDDVGPRVAEQLNVVLEFVKKAEMVTLKDIQHNQPASDVLYERELDNVSAHRVKVEANQAALLENQKRHAEREEERVKLNTREVVALEEIAAHLAVLVQGRAR